MLKLSDETTADEDGRLHPERRAAIGRMTGQGYTAGQIAEELGITRRSVVRNRAALGISQPAGRRFTPEEHERILAMLEDGCPIPEIARTVGRGAGTLLVAYRGLSTAKPLGSRAYKLRKQLGLA